MAIGLVGCLSTHLAPAATAIWTNGPTDLNWSSPDNWNTSVAPVATDDVKFYDDGITNGLGLVNNVVAASTTVQTVQYGNTNNYHTTQIAPGQTLTISNGTAGTTVSALWRGLTAGTLANTGYTTNYTTVLGPGSSLVVQSNNNVWVSQGDTAVLTQAGLASLDLSGLDNFTFDGASGTFVGRIVMGTRSDSIHPSFPSGILTLAKTNTITARGGDGSRVYSGVMVGYSSGNNGFTNALILGQTNAIFTYNMGVGVRKQVGFVGFNSAYQNNGAALFLRSSTGARLSNLWIADQQDESSSGLGATGTVDLSGGNVDALVDNIILARGQNVTASRASIALGTLTFDTGTIDVNTLRAGTHFGETQTTYQSVPKGYINVNRTGNGPAILRVNTLMTLAELRPPIAVNGGSVVGALTINGGAVYAQFICTTNVGATKGNSAITNLAGTLVVTNGIGTAAMPITSLALSNGLLQVPVGNYGATVFATTLTGFALTTNTINITSFPLIAQYPVEYPVISYTTLNGGGFALGALPSGSPSFGGYIVTNTSAKTIDVYLTNGPVGAHLITWTGATNGNWDTATTNWLDAAGACAFTAGDFVLFDDTASTNIITLVAAMTPNTMTFSNSAKDYAFGGAGSLNGWAGTYGLHGLDKEGSGLLVISNSSANAFTGDIIVGGGMLQIAGSNNRLPIGASVTLANTAGVSLDLNNLSQTLGLLNGGGTAGGNVTLGTGTLTLTNTGSAAYAGVISGTGKLVKTGAGTQTLSGTNTYSGGTTVSGGTLLVANTAESGVGTGSATISAGATLTIGGGGANGSVATAVITNNGTLSFNRTDAITFTNAIVGVGAVSKNATGKVIISNANSYAGTTTINVGSVQVASPGALSTNTVITSADASARVLLSSDTTLSNPLTITYKRNDVNFGASVENVSGTNTLAGAMTTLESPFGEVFAVQVDSGKLVVAGSFVNAGPAAHLRTIHLRGGVGDWQGAISNGTAVTAVQMDNAGTWILSGTNNYTGGTTVAGGTLLVNGQLISAANSVAINNNGTLGGAGIIAGPVTNNAGGTLAPTGVLTINNALSLDGSSTTLMALSTAGGSAKVQGLSSVDMAGTLTVTLAGMPVGGEVFQLIQATAYNGGFWGYTLPTLPPGLSWNYGSLATDGTLRIDGTVIRPTINNLSFSGSSLLISATNGAPWYYFDILSTTNVALPISSWTSEQTAYFDGSGNFDGSITVDPAVPQKFFTIQMHY